MLSASLPLGLQVAWNLGTKKHEWNGEDTLCAMYVERPKYFLFRDIWDSHPQFFIFCSWESQGVIMISSGIMRWEKNMTSQDFPGAPTLYSMPCVMGLNYSHAVFTAYMEKFFWGGGLEKLGDLPDHSSLLHQPCCIFFTTQALAFGCV